MLVPAILAASVLMHKLPPITDEECVTHEAALPQFTLASKDASEEVNDKIEEKARDTISYDDETEPVHCDAANLDNRSQTIDCQPQLVTEHFIGVRCHASANSGAHPTSWSESYNFRIDGDAVREIEMEDFFVAGYESALRTELRRVLPHSTHDPLDRIENATLGRDGVIFAFDQDVHVYRDVAISYAHLRKILRPEIRRAVAQR